MLIAVMNGSTLVGDNESQMMVEAVQKQVDLHFSSAWGIKSCTLKFYSKGAKIPGYAWKFMITDTSDVQGALGYHSLDQDQVDAFIMCKPVFDNGGSGLFNTNGLTVSSVLSHECLEALQDRYTNLWCDDGYMSYAVETCDPVQNNSYIITVNDPLTGKETQICVSDFIFPSWMNPEATKELNMPFNYMKTLTMPFTLDKGGYAIVRKGGPGTEQLIYGQQELPEWKKELKRSQFSRTGRRLKL